MEYQKPDVNDTEHDAKREPGETPTAGLVESPASSRDRELPEPPPNWRPSESHGSADPQSFSDDPEDDHDIVPESTIMVSEKTVRLNDEEAADFRYSRRLIVVSQIIAVVSLFFGGVMGSAVSLVIAIIGYRSMARFTERSVKDESVASVFRRSGAIAIIMCTFALLLNAVTLAMMYPALMQMLQSGDYGTLFGFDPSVNPANSGSSAGNQTWG